jgi:hypothetical protein
MTWKQKTVVRILLMIARIISEDEALAADLQHLSNHISQHRNGDD